MIPVEVIFRVFHIGTPKGTGSSVAVDIDGRQYLVTARHVVEHIVSGGTVQMMRHNTWSAVRVVELTNSEGMVDISLLALETVVVSQPQLTLPIGSDGISLGQDVFFLGFPHGRYGNIGMMQGWPLPFAKKAIVSNVTEPNEIIYLDGINNPGFSGGPVVFRKDDKYRLASIISGYLPEKLETAQPHATNSGIIISYAADLVLDLARRNGKGPVVYAARSEGVT